MTIYGRKITDDDMETIGSYMNDAIREELHAKIAGCTAEEFISAYLERDPDFITLLENEFRFDADEIPPEFYYWLDTEYLFGDYSVKKWALMRGEFTDDGEKDRDTEEVLTWGTIPETDDMNEAWNQIDEAIEAKLGFVPDYEVN